MPGADVAHALPEHSWSEPPEAVLGALGVDPARCAVVEDTVTGTRAGVAAGAAVFGYSPPEAGHDAPQALRDAGASTIFTDLSQLPALLA